MKIIHLVSNIIGKALEAVIAILLFQMLVLMTLQLLARHFPVITGVFWAEELSRFSMITLIFIGAAISCKNKDHIAATLLEENLKGKARIALKIGVSLLSVAFLAVFISNSEYSLFRAICPVFCFQNSAQNPEYNRRFCRCAGF